MSVFLCAKDRQRLREAISESKQQPSSDTHLGCLRGGGLPETVRAEDKVLPF